MHTIDVMETPFSPREATQVLNLTVCEYLSAVKSGSLGKSISFSSRPNFELYLHSFYDFFDYLIEPLYDEWLPFTCVSQMDELVSLVQSCILDDGDLVEGPNFQKNFCTIVLTKAVSEQRLSAREIVLVQEITKIWDKLGTKITQVLCC